jgi:hypothetical protein
VRMSKLQTACDWLREQLGTDGTPRDASVLLTEAKESLGVGRETMYEAKRLLGVRSVREKNAWKWVAPSDTEPEFDHYMEAGAGKRVVKDRAELSVIVSLALSVEHIAMLDAAKIPGESRSATARRLIEVACGKNATK